MVILWNLSESYEIFGIVIPGIMLWLAVGFVIIGTWMVHKIGHPLSVWNGETKNMKPITALPCSVSAKSKRNRFLRRRRQGTETVRFHFRNVFDTWLQTLIKRRHLNYFNFGYDQVSSVVPYIIAAPKYFAGLFQMGELMQTFDAFNGVRVSLSWFILNYPTLTEWKATVDRLTQFNSILQEKESESSFTRESTNDGSIELKRYPLVLAGRFFRCRKTDPSP